LHIGGPVTGFPHTEGPDTSLTGVLLATDPQLGRISTVNGSVTFLQLVGVDADELALAQEGGSAAVLAQRAGQAPLLVTVVGP
jgi:hypothetical protein